MIRAVLFDLDGTLVNSLADLAGSTNYALSCLGFAPHETEEYKYFVGDGIPKLIERALPENERTEQNKSEGLRLFMAHYRVHYMDKTYAYDGVTALLDKLRADRLKIAVISNKAQEMAERVVTQFFPDTFGVIAGKREGYAAKPDPALTLAVIRELGVKPSECLLVGDSGMDMAAAVNAGAVGVGALWGFRTGEELTRNGASYTVSDPGQIYHIVKE